MELIQTGIAEGMGTIDRRKEKAIPIRLIEGGVSVPMLR